MRECNGIKFFLTYPPYLSLHPGCRQGFGIPWYPARILPAVSHGLHERYTVMRVALPPFDLIGKGMYETLEALAGGHHMDSVPFVLLDCPSTLFHFLHGDASR